MNEYETKPPGRQQCFQRSAVEMANDQPLAEIAGGAGDQKSGRYSDEHIPVVCPRNMPAEDFGDYVGGKRADHHELTMGHVDDAHEPENDRQPQCHENENAGERKPRERVVNEADFFLIALHRLEALLNRLLELRIALRRFLQRLKRFSQAHATIAGGEVPQFIHCRQFFFPGTMGQMGAGDGFAQRRRESSRRILFELRFERWKRFLIGAIARIHDGGLPPCRIRIQQRQR